ncbi:hypothetical protein BH20ACI3_BH20ACI3_11430 [soil metagenome]
MGERATLSIARSRCGLRRIVPAASSGDGHSRGTNRATIALAESLCRAPHGINPARVLGPRDRGKRIFLTTHSQVVFPLLRAVADTSGAGERCARIQSDSTSRIGGGDCVPGSRWLASSLRATSCLTEIILPLNSQCSRIVNRYEVSYTDHRRLSLLSFGSLLLAPAGDQKVPKESSAASANMPCCPNRVSGRDRHRSRELKRYQHLSPLFKQQTVELIAQDLAGKMVTQLVAHPQLAPRHNGAKLLKRLAEPTGLEPATSDVTGRRSNQLNYDSACKPEMSKNP